MKLEMWDEAKGCWNLLEDFPCPYKEVPRRFLWWTWIGRDNVPRREWCIATVNKAKKMLFPNKGPQLRVRWRGHTMWQNGVWLIDTNDYEFGWGDPC